MQGRILTGTASWTDPGFVKDWYPSDVRAADRLRYYAEHFDLVEVNSTFYRIPEPRPARNWCAQTPPGFIFDVKLHRFLSRHSTKLEMLPPALRAKAVTDKTRVRLTSSLERAVAYSFLRGLKPLQECGKLGALLLQLSPAFRPKTNRLIELDSLFELLQGFDVAVELRNRDWVTDERLPETKRFFTSRHLAFVMVDAPEDPHFTVMPGHDLVTSRKLAFLRAHGRNASGYVRGRTVADRFNHDYTTAELKEIATRALSAAHEAKQVHIVFNNNASDYAPRAAMATQEMLAKDFPELKKAIRAREMSYA